MQRDFSAITIATSTTFISHITVKKEKKQEHETTWNAKFMWLLIQGKLLLSLPFSKLSKTNKKKGWISHLFQNKYLLMENNQVSGWIWDKQLLLRSYLPYYATQRKTRGQTEKGLLAGAGCTICP